MLMTGWHRNSIKENTIILQVKDEPAIGVVCGDDPAVELRSRSENLTGKDGICWVIEGPSLGRAICSSQYEVSSIKNSSVGCT